MGAAGTKRSAAQDARLTAIDTELNTLTATAADLAGELARWERLNDEQIASGSLGAAPDARPRGRKFREMFPEIGASLGEWKSPGEFLTVIGQGLSDPRLQASMSTGEGSAGGYSVPPGILGPWLDQALESEIVRSRATVWPMTTNERIVPAWDIMDRSGNDLAGFEIQWTPELGTIDLQTGKVRKIKLKAKKGAILAEASEELRADGLDFDQQMNAIMVKALSYGMDRSFMFGTGAGQPLGAYVSPARVVVAKEGGQGAATIIYDNLVKMFSRMLPSSVANTVWVAHPSTIPKLATLSVAVGVGGAPIPVMTESSGKFVILTRPVIFTEKAPVLGTEGDIALMDWTQYTVGIRSDVQIDRSAHVGFARDAMTYRLKVRLDGQPNITAPYQPPNSAPTLSPFVVLATRS
jgi:HK97 family phage major capsid protein